MRQNLGGTSLTRVELRPLNAETDGQIPEEVENQAIAIEFEKDEKDGKDQDEKDLNQKEN